MINLLSNWKIPILLTLLALSGALNYWHVLTINSQRKIITEYQAAEMTANAILVNDQKQMDALEQTLQAQQDDMLQKGQAIMQQELPEDCEKAVDEAVNNLKFIWHGGIP